MAKKKQKSEKGRSGVEAELKAEAKKLRGQLAAAEKSADKWKSKAKDLRSAAVGAKAELSAVRRRLEKAETSVAKWKDRVRSAPGPAGVAAAAPDPTATTASTTPDDSWTVTRLRAEARTRGVAGYSRKSKEQLLVELRG